MHSDDYTPTTEDVRADFGRSLLWPAAQSPDRTAAFDRWLAAHVAEKRAEWEAEQGETEWEYGNEMLMNNHTQIYPASSEFMAKAQAWLWPMYRRRKAGPWLPVPDTTSGGDCDHGSYCVNDEQKRVCLTCGDTTNHEIEGQS